MNIQQLVKPVFAVLCTVVISACSTSPAYSSQGILKDGKGMTYYTFDKDAKGSGASTCYGSCAATWPPVSSLTSKGNGYSAITRKDGSKQLTFNGSPIYYFAGDSKAGERKGDGIGGVWHTVKTNAQKSTSGLSSGYGYTY